MAKKPKPPEEQTAEQLTIDGFSYVGDRREVNFQRELSKEISRLRITGCSVLHVDIGRPCPHTDLWTAFVFYHKPTT
jgi:hypothetical protein